jgi:hypothetical protein
LDKYIKKNYPEFLVDNCNIEHNAHGVSLYSGGELIGIYGGHISFYRFGFNVVKDVDSTFGEDGLFMEWFKITYLDKIYNVNVVVPPF